MERTVSLPNQPDRTTTGKRSVSRPSRYTCLRCQTVPAVSKSPRKVSRRAARRCEWDYTPSDEPAPLPALLLFIMGSEVVVGAAVVVVQ